MNIGDEEFESICFEFGIEVEIGTGEDMNMQRVDDSGNQIDISKETVYKVEVGANRYDLLCVEGLSQALRAYLGLDKIPRLSIKNQSE